MSRLVELDILRVIWCVRKSQYIFNLLRASMARTAQMTGQTLREISFRAAQQTLRDFHMILLLNTDNLGRIIEAMPGIMAEPRVGDRPDRIERQAVKRRAKAYPKL